MKKTTKKEPKPMKLEVKKINTKQYETREEFNKAHKNDKKVETKKKVIQRKGKTWPRKETKTEAKTLKQLKQMRANSWRDIKLDDELVQNLIPWRPRVFKSPAQLWELFQNYLLSCMEKRRYAELVPIKTEEKDSDDFLEVLDEEIQSSKKDGNRIDNNIVSKYEIIEDVDWKVTPSKWWFLIYCWWITYHTFDNYKENPEFLQTIEQIENTLESILVNQAAAWKYNPRIAEFVLNTSYWRVPNQKVEQTNTVELDATKLNDD